MPFSMLHLKSIPMTARSVRRVWIGREGGLDHGADLGENEEDQTVYIGKTSERYHWFRDCHYLSNKIEAVAWEDLDGFRNSSGSRYRPCSVCGGGTGGTVYIMGERRELPQESVLHDHRRLRGGGSLERGGVYGSLFLLREEEGELK